MKPSLIPRTTVYICRKQQPIQEHRCTDDLGGQLQLGHCMMDCTQLAPAFMPISVHVMVLQMMMATLLYQVLRLSSVSTSVIH